MTINKIKVGFDPTTIWDKQDFRDFIKLLVSYPDNYDVYIVTTNSDTNYITDVALEAGGIDLTTNVFQVPNNSAVVAKLSVLKVLIHLANDNVLVNFINTSIGPLQLNKNNVTGCQALITNNIVNTYDVRMKYLTFFDFWVEQINKQYAS